MASTDIHIICRLGQRGNLSASGRRSRCLETKASHHKRKVKEGSRDQCIGWKSLFIGYLGTTKEIRYSKGFRGKADSIPLLFLLPCQLPNHPPTLCPNVSLSGAYRSPPPRFPCSSNFFRSISLTGAYWPPNLAAAVKGSCPSLIWAREGLDRSGTRSAGPLPLTGSVLWMSMPEIERMDSWEGDRCRFLLG